MTVDDLCQHVRDLFATRDQSALVEANARAEAAEARAATAEEKLAQARALFA